MRLRPSELSKTGDHRADLIGAFDLRKMPQPEQGQFTHDDDGPRLGCGHLRRPVRTIAGKPMNQDQGRTT